MNLYKEYVKEVSGLEVKNEEDYFFTYNIYKNYVYLQDVYIKKESRNKGLMETIFEETYKLAKDNECNFVTSSICINTTDEVKSRTHHILTKNEFKEYERDDNMIYYCKEIL